MLTNGESEAQVGFLKQLVHVAYGHADDTTQTDDLTEHFHDSGDNDTLIMMIALAGAGFVMKKSRGKAA